VLGTLQAGDCGVSLVAGAVLTPSVASGCAAAGSVKGGRGGNGKVVEAVLLSSAYRESVE